jgi:hypothetical protein
VEFSAATIHVMSALARDGARVASVVARYEELLAGRHRLSTCELLTQARSRPDLQYADEPVLGILRPHFIGEATYRHVCRVASLVSRALDEACSRLVTDRAFRQLWGLEAAHIRLVRAQIRHGSPLVLGRFDGFLGPDGGYSIIEYSNTPGAMIYGQRLAEIFEELPIMRDLRRSLSMRFIPTAKRMVDAYRRAHRQWGGRGRPRLAVVDRDLLSGSRYVEKRAATALLREGGVDVDVVRSEDLTFARGRLRARGSAVDAVYYLTDEVLEERGEDAIIRAIESGAVWLVVSPRDTARFSKAAFAALSDPKYASTFGANVQRALRRHVPWTRVLKDGRTRYGQRQVDLMEFVESHREHLALKPCLGASGSGVVLGWETDAAGWRAAIKAASKELHVVQERVPIQEQPLPVLRRGQIVARLHRSGLDPYTWNGRAAGCLVRASTGEKMGLLSGTGSIMPLCVVA